MTSWCRGRSTALAEAVRQRDEHRTSGEWERERIGGLVVGQVLHLPGDAEVDERDGELDTDPMVGAAADDLGVDLRSVEDVVGDEIEVVEDAARPQSGGEITEWQRTVARPQELEARIHLVRGPPRQLVPARE